jgi:DNA helicase-2/ATP-dependent DNA helicase PcrA
MPSRFLQDIPHDLIEPYGPASPRNLTWETADLSHTPAAQQILTEAGAGSSAFRAGDRVRHPAFGKGMVVSISGADGSAIISVAFPDKGIKKLDPEYANLEKL